jgi:virginiamycin A acetyltransferase
MQVGEFTYGHENISHIFENVFPNVRLIIGKFCSIASNVKVYYGQGYHDSKNISTYPFGCNKNDILNLNCYQKLKTNGNIIIGNDVWIGDNVTINSGVVIGDGAIIATNSHVTSNVEPYSIVGGNPSKLIKYRFEKNIIGKFLEIKWWDWELKKIRENAKLLNGDNIKLFFEKNNL